MSMSLTKRRWRSLAAAIATLVAVSTVWSMRREQAFVQRSTMGDLEVIHAPVLRAGIGQQSTSRLAAGDEIVTDAAGRARLWLADGTSALLDGNTSIKIAVGRIDLLRGRLFVDTPEGRNLAIVAGKLEATVAFSKVAFERSADGDQTKAFCAQGELLASAGAAPTRVPRGETLTLVGSKVTVEPEKAFDDWTGGLAVPWAAKSLQRSALAEAWTTEAGEPHNALANSLESIEVELKGEFAITRKKSRYYNGNDSAVAPMLRFALPQTAILTKVGYRDSTDTSIRPATVEICASDMLQDSRLARLEWAGNGWVSAVLPEVKAGGSIDVELEYADWMAARAGRVEYRVPIGHRIDAPLVGELSVVIDASGASADSIEANQGATVEGKKLTWRSADSKPSDDWAVSYAPAMLAPRVVRAYVEAEDAGGDPYVMLRTETDAKETQSVELSIVVDSSRSMGASGLELARQVVDALLGNLSDKDRVVVLVADEQVTSLGSDVLSPNAPALRASVATKLAQVRAGGASNIGRALERAADALDASNDSTIGKMLVYIGDARPTLGELSVERIRAQLQRRTSGIPRIAGIALGPSADKWLLARLVAGTGPVHSVVDRSEAAQVAASVVSAVAQATYRDAKFELGPNVDRIYPREGRAAIAGSTAMVLGRLRGALPQSVKLSYRDTGGTKLETLRVERFNSPLVGEIARRWAQARVDEIISGNEGIESALLLAQQHRLLLPWTEWVLEPAAQRARQSCTSFQNRVVELSSLHDSPYAHRLEAPPPVGSGWLEPPLRYDPGQSLQDGAIDAGRARVIAAKSSLTACRDLRLPIIADLPCSLEYGINLSSTGRVERVTLTPRDGRRDSIMVGCMDRVIRGLSFVGAERPVTIVDNIQLPPPKNLKRTQCSIVSNLPLPLRRSIWATRQGPALQRYEGALAACEMSTWTERRELLLLLIRPLLTSGDLLALAQDLAGNGHQDAADFVRDNAVQRVATLDELKELRGAFLAGEPNLDADIAVKVRRAATDKQRLEIVGRALAMAPHSPLGRRLQLLLLERISQAGQIQREVESLRRDPFTDAGLIAAAAATLRRLDLRSEAQRTFSELFERAPKDPWILAFAGDQLRAEGFAEQALIAYESLERVVPSDTTNLLRSGMAQSAAGRIDIATRLLDRAIQTGGRSDDQRLSELGSVVRAVVLGRAELAATNPTEKLELRNRLTQTALPDVAAIVYVETAANPEFGLHVLAYRGDDRVAAAPDLDAMPLGAAVLFVDRGANSISIEVSRQTLAGLARPLPVTLSVLTLGEQPSERTLRQQTTEIQADQEKVTIKLNMEARP